jgi:hypothetical protein
MSDESNPAQQNQTPSSSGPESLWPETIQRTTIRAPVSILKEQASLLGQRTQNIVIADVRTLKLQHSRNMDYAFVIIAPALNEYTLWLFRISHDPTQLYPVEITSDVIVPEGRVEGVWKASDEITFKSLLKTLFSNTKTVSAIQSLLAQSEGLALPIRDEDIPF